MDSKGFSPGPSARNSNQAFFSTLSRPAGEGDARDLLQVVEEAEFVPAGQQRGDDIALPVADLEGEQAVGPQRGARLGNEAAIDVEAVRPGAERGGDA